MTVRYTSADIRHDTVHVHDTSVDIGQIPPSVHDTSADVYLMTQFMYMSDDAVHEASVEVGDECAHEGHLFAGVVEHDGGVVAGAAQTVGRHHHGQIVDIHLV